MPSHYKTEIECSNDILIEFFTEKWLVGKMFQYLKCQETDFLVTLSIYFIFIKSKEDIGCRYWISMHVWISLDIRRQLLNYYRYWIMC